MKTAITWQQLTELVASAIGLPVRYDTLEEVFYDEDDNVFDPVRDDGDCFRLAVVRRVAICPSFGFSIAIPPVKLAEPLCIHEAHGDDPMAATRIAVCRSVLLNYQLQ
jgi:hypothetical protein